MNEKTVWERQQEDYFVKFGEAWRQLYSDFKLRYGVWTTITIAIAVIGTAVIGLSSIAASFIGVATAVVIFVEWMILTWINDHCREAALIQEQYDCELLKIPWNETDPKHPDKERIKEAATRYLATASDEDIESLRKWYAIEFANRPIREARILCQRENVYWDSDLRTHWARWFGGVLIGLVVVVVVISMVFNMTLPQFFAGPFFLLLPLLNTGFQSVQKHRRSASKLEQLKAFTEPLVEKSRDPSIGDAELERDSRALQDKIFATRSESPAVPDWFYRRHRKRQEEHFNQPRL